MRSCQGFLRGRAAAALVGICLAAGSEKEDAVEESLSETPLPTTLGPEEYQGNKACWAWHFTYAFCCNASLGEGGNPDCWDKRRYNYRRCCLTTDEALPPFEPPPDPEAAKSWRVVVEKDLGGWMVHELVFFEDSACEKRIRKYARTLDSGHRSGYPPKHAFDQWVKSTDEYFWYSNEAPLPGDAWLGLELVRPTRVKCIGIWHNNIPEVPVELQKWDVKQKSWVAVHNWPSVDGQKWAYLPRDGPPLATPPTSEEL